MKEQDRSSLKKYFETGDRPTEDHFVQLIDSFVNKKEDQVTVGEANNIGIGTTTPKNKLDVAGAGAIGSAYAGSKVAPADSLIVEGRLGIGLISPTNKLDVHGAAAIGKGYTDKKAPDDGLIVQGPVGLGLATPEAPLDVNGDVKARGNLNVDSNLTVGGNLTVQGEMVVKQVEYHEGNVQLGDQPEDTISIFGTLQGKNPSTALVVNSPIQANEGVTTNKDLNVKGKLKVDGNTELGLAGASETPRVDLNAVIHSGLNAVTLRSKGKDSNSFGLKVQNSEGADQLAVRSDGKVGIGTTTPAYTLDVNGSLNATELHGNGSKLTNINASAINTGQLDTDQIKADQITARSERGLKLTNTRENGLLIHETGRIGIGTEDPAAKLHIYDLSVKATDKVNDIASYHLFIQGSSEDKKGFGIAMGSAGYVGSSILHIERGTASMGDLALYTKQNEEGDGLLEVMRLNYRGNVGIGLIAPEEKLEVDGNIKAKNFMGNGADLDGLDASKITSGTLDANRLPAVDSELITGEIDPSILPNVIPVTEIKATNQFGLKLNDRNNNGIHILNGGNVVIGTGTSSEKLTVFGNISANAFKGDGAALKNLNASEIKSGTLSDTLFPNSLPIQEILAKDDGLKLSNPAGEGLYIDLQGKVGIFNEKPDTALHVNGEITAKKFLLEDGTELGTGDSLWIKDTKGNITFNDGNVGIGIQPASYKFHMLTDNYGFFSQAIGNSGNKYAVYGTANGNGSLNMSVYGRSYGEATYNYGLYGHASGGTNNYAIYASGNITYTGSLQSASDKRLKKDIKPLGKSLEKILQIQGKSYLYKDDSNPNREFGLIAQEVEKLFPETIGTIINPEEYDPEHPDKKPTKKPTEYKSVKYISFIPILIESIKEQQKLIEKLTERIEKFESTKK